MGWGVGLGAAADAALSTYTKIEDNTRANNADKRAQNADDRAAAAERRRAQAAEDEAAVYRTGDQGGAPVVNPIAAASDDDATPVSVKPTTPGGVPDAGTAVPSTKTAATGVPTDRMNLGGPKPQKDAALTPAQDEVAETAAAKGSGLKVSKPASVAPGAGPVSSSQAWANYQRLGTKAAYDHAVTIQAAEQRDAVVKQEMAARAIKMRAEEHTLNQTDIENSQKNSQEAAARATARLDGYKNFSDDVAANDPRVFENTKAVMGDLQRTHDKMADGRVAKWEAKPDGIHVTYSDGKTGKPLSEDVFATVGDVRRATQMAGMATDPANYPKVIAANALTKYTNENSQLIQELQKSGDQLKLEEAQKLLRANDHSKEIYKAIDDPTATALLEPESRRKLDALATEAGFLDEKLNYKTREPKLDENGKPMFDDGGKAIMQETEHNRLRDALDYNTPKKSVSVTDPKTGAVATTSIEEVGGALLKNYDKLAKDANYDPNVMAAGIRKDLMGKGFDQRVVDWMLPKVLDAGRKQQEQTIANMTMPKGLGSPASAPGVAVKPVLQGGPRGSGIPTRTQVNPAIMDTINNLQKNGLQPR